MIPQRPQLVLPGQRQATPEETIAALRSERQMLLRFLMALVLKAGGEVRLRPIILDPIGGDFAAVQDPETGETVLRVAGATLVDAPEGEGQAETPKGD